MGAGREAGAAILANETYRRDSARDDAHNGAVRVAVVSPHPVVPATSGDRIRTTQLLKALRAAGVDASVLAHSWGGNGPDMDVPVKYVPGRPEGRVGWATWRARLALARRANPYAICRMPGASRAMTGAIEGSDADVVDFQHTFAWLPTGRPNVLTVHNVLSHQLGRQGRSSARPLAGLAAMEREALEGAGAVVTLSSLDTERAQALTSTPGDRFFEVPLGYEPTGAGLRPQRDEMATVAYVGSFDYAPNVEAAAFLVGAWPAMREAGGLRALSLIGRAADRHFSARDGIEVHSDVPDVSVPLAAADVLVVPLASAGGVRVKIIEAFALGLPVLSTEVGIEGLEAEDGVHAVVVPTADDMVEGLRRMRPQGVRQRLAANAYELWRERYSPARMASRMVEVYEAVLAR